MRIVYVSTYPPIECGVGTYCRYLSDAVIAKQNDVFIVSQIGALGKRVFPVYHAEHNDIAFRLFKAVEKLTPDVVHVQHEFGLYGSDGGSQVLDFIVRARMGELPVVTTLHTVDQVRGTAHERLAKLICLESSAVIVHESYQKEYLCDWFDLDAANVHVIPHGVRDIRPVADAKKLLGVADKKVILLCGYLRASKRYETIVEIMPDVVVKEPDAVLLVAVKCRNHLTIPYRKELFGLIENSPVKDSIKVIFGQFPQYTFDTILSAADIMALPYSVGAQSGIMAQAAAFQVPTVSSALKGFLSWNDAVKGGLVAHDLEDYPKYILELLQNTDVFLEKKRNLTQALHNRSWSVLAKEHLEIYRRYLEPHSPSARFFYVHDEE